MRFSVIVAVLVVVLAAPARAEVRLIDVGTGAVTGPVHPKSLIGWDGGAALLVRDDGKVFRVGLDDGSVAARPQFDGAVSIGPRGHTVHYGLERVEVRDPSGKAVLRQRVPISFEAPSVAWAREQARVAVVGGDRLLAIDLSTRKVLYKRDGVTSVTPQAFAYGDFEVAATIGRRVVSVPDGRELHQAPRDMWLPPAAAIGPDGTVAITHDDAIRVLGNPGLHVAPDPTRPAIWSPDGSTLAFGLIDAGDGCSSPQGGLGVAKPGGKPRVLIPPSEREIRDHVWSPDGRTLAVELGPDVAVTPEQRGRRRPWPKRIARDYGMFSPRGNAAMRRIVVRAARALRRGAGRDETLRRVRQDYVKVDERFKEAGDTAVRDALAEEIDKWLHAAGWERVDALDEVTCGGRRR